ncbi:hypothetical protein V1264_018413 [Littorina saxatilis]|uniref:Strictosidine synthase conserved region domain-containing protein n=2 Tax=Littorina saxatilis TaxID=31220 RepID=A0AAN9GE56_9CAEN
MAEILASMRAPQGPKPVVVKMPNPPALEGPLAPNDFLTRAQSYALNLIDGPESLVVVNRYIYTGLRNGWIVEIRPNGSVRKILRMSYPDCGKPNAEEGACGRPMGMRADRQGYLVVADAYSGIFRVHPRTGRYTQLVDAKNLLVKDKPLGYINDLAVTKDGTIFFTSSSNKWKPSQYLNIIFEGETSGRVLVYNPREMLPARRVQELVTNLHYPNGLELGPNDEFLLIGEGGRSRIFRAWVGRNHPKHGTIDTFAENLPGFVDNIRQSPRKTYWVALSRGRHASLPSVLDTYGDKPDIRANLIDLVKNNMIFDDPNFGIVVELSDTGTILRSLQDPDGSMYTSVSEVAEENDALFIASKSKNFVGIVDLRSLPKPQPKEPEGSGIHTINIEAIADPNLKTMLSGVKTKLGQLKSDQMVGVALLLAKRLYEISMQFKKAQAEIAKLTLDLRNIQAGIGQSGGPNTGTETGPNTGTGTGPNTGTGTGPNTGTGTGPNTGTGTGPSTGTGTSSQTTSNLLDTTPPVDTTASGAVVAPDQGGSSGLGGSIDGGVGTTSPPPAVGTTAQGQAGATTPSSGGTTPSVASATGGGTTASGATASGTTPSGITASGTTAGAAAGPPPP